MDFFHVFYPMYTVSWKHLEMPDRVPNMQLLIMPPTYGSSHSRVKTGLLWKSPSAGTQQIRRPPPLEKGVKQGLWVGKERRRSWNIHIPQLHQSSIRTAAIRCNSNKTQEPNHFPQIQKSSRFKSPLLRDYSRSQGGKALNNPFHFYNVCREG